MPLLIRFRTSCSRAIGFGHLRRCLTLADELRDRGAEVSFLLSGDPSSTSLVDRAGHSAVHVEAEHEATYAQLERASSAALVVDDYSADDVVLSHYKQRVERLVVIDDVADRRLDVADLVIAGNADSSPERYSLPAGRLCCGPRYAMLRRQFRGLGLRRPRPKVDRVLVMLGGSDPLGLTGEIVCELPRRLPHVRLEVVLGPGAPADIASGGGLVTIHRSVDEVAALMSSVDLAVCAGGQTVYELAATGTPAVVVIVADNQRGQVETLSRVPTLLGVEASLGALLDAVDALASDYELRQTMSHAGQLLVDGLGAARAADAICELVARAPERGGL